MRWQMRPVCSLQAAQIWVELQVLGAAVERFLEGFFVALTATANAHVWHLAVKLNASQSLEWLYPKSE